MLKHNSLCAYTHVLMVKEYNIRFHVNNFILAYVN